MLPRFYVDSEGAVAPQPVGLPRHKAIPLAKPVWVGKRRLLGRRLQWTLLSLFIFTGLLTAHPLLSHLF